KYPLWRTRPAGAVRDLGCVLAMGPGGRPRTRANETTNETVAQAGGLTPFSRSTRSWPVSRTPDDLSEKQHPGHVPTRDNQDDVARPVVVQERLVNQILPIVSRDSAMIRMSSGVTYVARGDPRHWLASDPRVSAIAPP